MGRFERISDSLAAEMSKPKDKTLTLDLGTMSDFKGPKGDIGDTGLQGDRGPMGIQGRQGPIGPRGPKGEQGDSGPRGKVGKSGNDGRSGRDGRNGNDGKDGNQGDIGPMPKHEIKEGRIRFEMAPGKWGKWLDIAEIAFPYMRGGGNLATKGDLEGIDSAEKEQIEILKSLLKPGYTAYYGDQDNDVEGNPILIEIYSDPGKTDKLFTKDITWTSGNRTTIVTTDEQTAAILTQIENFDANGNRTSYSEVLS